MASLFTSFQGDSSEPGEWLARSEGFAVEVDGRRIGVVEELRFGTRVDYPDALVARGGLLGRRRTTIPVSEVEQVRARERRILLRTSADHPHSRRRPPKRRDAAARDVADERL